MKPFTCCCFFYLDIDECTESNTCHSNATCNNTIGSFICACDRGYNGDGVNCSGMETFNFSLKYSNRTVCTVVPKKRILKNNIIFTCNVLIFYPMPF